MELQLKNWGSGNDQFMFLDDLGNLCILQDGEKTTIWMVTPNHTQASPKWFICEVYHQVLSHDGMTFTPDNKVYVCCRFSTQAEEANSSTFQIDAEGDTVRMNLMQNSSSNCCVKDS